MGSSKKVTVGYRYYMGLHFGLCHGPVDAVLEIKVGDRVAWSGAQNTSGTIAVFAPELFGGDKREGGVGGALDIMMGEASQAQNSYLASRIGAGIPSFRGILSAVFNGGLITSNNPYVKPWAFRVKRILEGWTGGSAWYPAKAEIGAYSPLSSLSDWVARSNGFGTLEVNAVAYASGHIVAVGEDGKAQRSADGITWVDSPIGADPSIELHDIAAFGNNLIAVGTGGTIKLSGNGGASWSTITTAYTSALYCVGVVGNVLIVGYHVGNILRSTDGGSSWSAVDTGAGLASFVAIGYGGGVLVACGQMQDESSIIYYSLDAGVSWTQATDLPEVGRFSKVVYGNGRFVTLSYDGKILTSENGINWTLRTSALDVGDFPGGVVFEYGMFVASKNEHVVRSKDAITWEEWSVSAAGHGLWDLHAIPDGFVGVGPDGKISTTSITTVTPDYPNMNPAHIIYQCLTDTAWGMGYPTAAIDDESFTSAADVLFNEGFGLTLVWNQQETIEAFAQIILDHIGGLLYVKPDTGSFALKLIRADYDRGGLPQYGPATLISVTEYQRQAWGETINEVTVVYTDAATGKGASVTVQDTANVMVQGGVVSQTRSYPGINVPMLAQRVALRDLQAASTPLAKVRITATRAAWHLFPGNVFRLTWPEYGIDDVVYRALIVNLGTLQNGEIIIDAVEDVFGLPDNTFLGAPVSGWEDPSSEPAAAPYHTLIEAPYWDLVRNLSAADMDYVDPLSGYLETLATRPSSDALNYSIFARTGSADYTRRGTGEFCPSATISGALTHTTTALTLTSGVDLDLVSAGEYAVIDNEYVLVEAINANAGTATISRGVLDTLPAEHAAGARIWFADGFQGVDFTEFADGEEVDVKLLPLTGRGELALALAPVDSMTFDQRQARPYPPANLKFDGVAWPLIIDSTSDVVLTWAHRDRTLQTAYLVEQDEASIGPEAGVTYSVEVADESLSVIYSATGITAATATVPASSLTDGLLRWRVWSVRGGLACWQIWDQWIAWGDVRITEDGEIRLTEAGESVILE